MASTLLDEPALFLHRVITELPVEKQRMLEKLNSSDEDLIGKTALLVDDDARNIFALSSDSEQFPLSVVEAMAAGLPVVAPAVGDIADMVSEANAEFIAPPGNEEELRMALVQLAVSKDLRREVGEANRAKAVAQFDEAKMVATYRRLYSSAMGLEL